jgi:hypothetical protein
MIEVMQIPGDEGHNNARRFLELENESLLDNKIGRFAHLMSGIHPDSAYATWHLNETFNATKGQTGRQFMGAFDRTNGGLKLVGGMEARSASIVSLGQFFRPIDTLATIYSANRGYPLEAHLAISSLVARKGNDQTLIIQDLLLKAIDQAASSSNAIYLKLPRVDPAHEVIGDLGFVPAGLDTVNKHGIPHTLFVRGTQLNS